MKSDRTGPVAIVGGGFSGTMTAAQLARRGVPSVLVEGSGREGKGVAYSTGEPSHLLNVRAAMMSAWPDRPDDFAAFAAPLGCAPDGFAQRRWFGAYLGQILEAARDGGAVELVQDSAVEASFEGTAWRLTLASGRQLEASALVLAGGNQPPEPLPGAGASERVVSDPWGAQAQAAIARAARDGDDVLLIGTGLTAVDTVLSLAAAEHDGRVTAISRRGLIPRAHAALEPAPVDRSALPPGGLRTLLRWLRRRSAEVGWRAAVDSLRPHSHALWQSLSLAEQHRFLRHARPWWDVHRHRIAPEVAEQLAVRVAEGRLQVMAGRIRSVRAGEDDVQVEVARRGGRTEALDAGHLFNCTGPLGSVGRSRDPLLRSLLDRGAAHPDALGIGLDVEASHRVRGAERLWALGALTKGRYWEIIAVPDIRDQAQQVAEDIAMELAR
jgi:uncharacterized NAD(P)/FAD-binding protein YdhS